MSKEKGQKKYDLEQRTFKFAQEVIALCSAIPRTIANTETMKQLIRSAGSVGANYIEANEALSKKDFSMRIKICRKESKESQYWLRLLQISDSATMEIRTNLTNEAVALMKIFASILQKSS